MHESSLGKQLVSATLERAHAAGAIRVTAVKASVAESERLDPGAIRFHFAAHARGTIADGASLELEVSWLEARCDECQRRYQPVAVRGAFCGEGGYGVVAATDRPGHMARRSVP